MPVYLSIQKPYVMTLAEAHAIESPADARRMAARLKARGYDGIYVKEERAIVAFAPEQIKSTKNLGTFDPANPDIRYARAESDTGGVPLHTTATLRRALSERLGKRAFEKLLGSGQFRIVTDSDPLPARLDDGKGGIRGVYDPVTKISWLVPANIRPGEELGVLLHEIGIHAKLEGLLGSKLHGELLGQIKAILAPLEKAIADGKSAAELAKIRERISAQSPLAAALVEARGRVPQDTKAAHLIEEVVAYLVENRANHNLPLVRRILAAIRAFLLRMGVPLRNLTSDDLVALAKAAVRRVSRGETVSRLPFGIDAGLSEAHINSSLADAKLFGNSSTRQAIRVKGFNALDRERQQAVLSTMLAVAQDREIARVIVEAVPVDVVNNLIGKKGATQDLLNDPAMLKDLLSVNPKVPVPRAVSRFVEAVAALESVVTGPAAKQVLPGGVAGRPIEGRAADRTGAGDRHGLMLPQYAAQAPTFYSEMSKFVDAKGPGKTTAAQWKVLLDGWAKAGKFKGDELEWSGVREWLDLQEGAVTKAQVLGFVRENGVRVEDTPLGGETPILDERGRRQTDETGSIVTRGQPTRYADRVLPGGENYREVLLRLPERNTTSGKQFTAQGVAQSMGRNWSDVAAYERQQFAEQAERLNRPTNEFRSTHYDEPNILAHVRFNERTDAEGRRVLFLEEIQSDWAQKGKREGFAKPFVEPARVTELPAGWTWKLRDNGNSLALYRNGEFEVSPSFSTHPNNRRFFWARTSVSRINTRGPV